MIIEQLSVFLENRAGRLTEVTRILARAGINISAQYIAEGSEYGVLRMVVSEPASAREALVEQGFSVILTQVLCVTVPDTPGALHRVLEILSDAGQSLEYMYAMSHEKNARVILCTRDITQTLEVLRQHRQQLVGFDALCGIESPS